MLKNNYLFTKIFKLLYSFLKFDLKFSCISGNFSDCFKYGRCMEFFSRFDESACLNKRKLCFNYQIPEVI